MTLAETSRECAQRHRQKAQAHMMQEYPASYAEGSLRKAEKWDRRTQRLERGLFDGS